MNPFNLYSPMEGEVIPITEVPDPVFSEKMAGDGVAIVPSNGKIFSPVDGTVTTVFETLHAYGITSKEGIDILIHIGLETVTLGGKGFKALVKAGDSVKAGDPIAEVDLEYLKSQNLKTVSPVVICDGSDITLENLEYPVYGVVKPGDIILTGTVNLPENNDSTDKEGLDKTGKTAGKNKKKKKSGINFDFLQKLGKTLMAVIAVMPAAGLMISIGSIITSTCSNVPVAFTIGSIISAIGWAIINNLSILFAAAIGGTWARDRAGGSFAAIISYCVINIITGTVYGVDIQMLNDPTAVVHDILGHEMVVANYFVNVLNKPALNMGVFVGIVAGFLGAIVYNRFYNFSGLPDALSFFNGKRFVPLVVMFYSALAGLLLSLVWPVVQTGINRFGIWIADSSDTSSILAPFIYGTLERLLLPFGLHHMLTIPMNYTSFGGTYTILTGPNAGTQVYGQDPLWLAWVTDLINLKKAGNMQAYNELLTMVTPARFKVGQMIGATGLLNGILLAMYLRIEKEKRRKYNSMFISTALSIFLTGVTEPGEFMFMFCAFPLYIVYAVIQGLAFALSGVIHLRLHSFGNLELLTRIPLAIEAGLTGDIINFVIAVIVFFGIGYGVAYFMIGVFKFATPGRFGNEITEDTDSSEEDSSTKKSPGKDKAERIIALLGGRKNIDFVDACMTRLRVTVKDTSKVADLDAWKKEGALGLVMIDNGVQAIYGPKADNIKSDINDIL
ncbi:MAG: PTS transporter subunit EIIC [Lachnospiraceae bacterium]|nr:PTS transporter subunit EIIC [Lachnospiraceae bacterium]